MLPLLGKKPLWDAGCSPRAFRFEKLRNYGIQHQINYIRYKTNSKVFEYGDFGFMGVWRNDEKTKTFIREVVGMGWLYGCTAIVPLTHWSNIEGKQ